MDRLAKLLLFLSASGLLASCSVRLDESPSIRSVSFRAMRETVTKTALKGNDVYWSDGDRIAIFSGGNMAEFTTSEVNGATCTFTGILPGGGPFHSLYPFSNSATCTDGVMTAVLPSVQKPVKGNFDPASALAVSRAAKAGEDMIFKNVGALVRFSIDEETAADLVEVVLKSVNGTPLSGQASISFSGTDPVVNASGGSDQVTLQGHFEAGEYCFVVYPGAHDGLTLTFKKAKKTGHMSSSFKGTFVRSTLSDMGTLSPSTWEDSDNYKPVTLDVVFSDGANFSNPFEYPDLMSLSSTGTSSFAGARTELGLPEAKGGYVFYIFGSKGVSRSNGGIVFGSSSGDYIAFPAIPGLCLNRVTVTSGNSINAVNIASDEGENILGGDFVQSASAAGQVLSWSLYGSSRGCAYKIQNASTLNVSIRRIQLEYGIDPLVPPTSDVSPFDYGLREATTGQERFQALYRAHSAAVGFGVGLDYTGVGTVDLVIPPGAKSIPLPRNIDFKGTVFKVRNDVGKMFLFNLENVFTHVSVSGAQIDNADYASSPALASGLHILKVSDAKHWVDDREGFDHPHDRIEAFLVRDGVGSCGPIASYSTPATLIDAEWCPADDGLKTFGNVTLIRDPLSTQNCCLADFRGQNNLLISNILVQTPPDTGIYGDTILDIRYCTNVTCEDLTFNGQYDGVHASGYGLSINATWNTTFRRIHSHNLWAAFGCNNMQDSFLYDSDVERFDIHCYGKNITVKNSTLEGKGLPCSSIYGTIYCENVKFKSCFLYSMRADYNSYVPFDLVIRNCEMWPDGQNGLVYMGNLDNNINARPELAKKCWPNLDIDGLTVHLPSFVPSFSFFYITDAHRYKEPVGYISSVKVKNMTYLYSGSTSFRLYVVTYPLTVENSFKLELDNVELLPEGTPGNARLTVNVVGDVSTDVVNSRIMLD